jgi:RNA polymerase sigma-70 factor (ECF subfamily)
MGCAGTLSWSVLGLGWPAARERGRDFSQAGAAGREGHAQRASLSGAAVFAPADRTVRMQERGLEIDWSQVVRRAMDGDSGAWAEMVRAHHKRVYGLCYRFTGQAADAEDLTQEVFLKVYTSLRSFDASRGSLQVWIVAMTRNLLVDHFRRTKNRRLTSSLDEGWDESGEMVPVDRLVTKGPSQHDLAAGRELEKMVQEALKQVPADLREAVILRDLQDMDYKEIAQVVGIPEGTVKSRISRGRAELARLLERTYREVM